MYVVQAASVPPLLSALGSQTQTSRGRSTSCATFRSVVRIGVRELRQHASRYLARVKAGETVEVTERGELVALLVPPAPPATLRERLIAAGQLLPAAEPLSVPARVRAPGDSRTVLDALRADH